MWIEFTRTFECNLGVCRPGDMIECDSIVRGENVYECIGVNGTEFDVPINAARVLQDQDGDQEMAQDLSRPDRFDQE